MKLLSISVLALVARSASSFSPLPLVTIPASYSTSTKLFSQTLPILASDDVMSAKSHGTSDKPVMKDLRWSCDYEVADRICNFNRHYAEYAGTLWGARHRLRFFCVLLHPCSLSISCYCGLSPYYFAINVTEPQVTGQAQLSSKISRTVTIRMHQSSFTTVLLENCCLPPLSDGPWTTSSRRAAPTVGRASVMKNAIGNMFDVWQMENASVRPGPISDIIFQIRMGIDTASTWSALRDFQRTSGELL